MEEMAWIFDPYRNFRAAGLLEKKDPEQYRSVITDVENRILKYVAGHGERIELEVGYEILDKNKNFVLVNETGKHARTGMFADGIEAFISVRTRSDGHFQYTVGKLSPFISSDFLLLTEMLNSKDPCVTASNKWGGGNNVFGSPRATGSGIAPADLMKLTA